MRSLLPLGLILLLSAVLAAWNRPEVDPIIPEGCSLAEICASAGLADVEERAGRRRLYAGGGRRMVAAVGLDVVLVDDQTVYLGERVMYRGDAFWVSSRGAAAVAAALAQPVMPPKPEPTRVVVYPKVIVLDAGHGGSFRGAEGVTGLIEKDVTLDVAQRVARILQERGYRAVLTRDADESLESGLQRDLVLRAEVAARERADAFVSVHCNHAENSRARGYEVYVLRQRNPRKGTAPRDVLRTEDLARASRDLAGKLGVSLASLGTPNRGVKEAGFQVLESVTCPAVLVEIGFLSHAQEEERLRDSAYRERVAVGLADGLEAFLERK